MFSSEVELGCVAHQAVVGDPKATVQTVEKVEGLSGKFQAPAVPGVELARQAHIGGGVVGAGEGIAARAGQAVVVAVVVLIGVPDDGGADRTPAACGDDSGIFPAFRKFSVAVFTRATPAPAMRRMAGSKTVPWIEPVEESSARQVRAKV